MRHGRCEDLRGHSGGIGLGGTRIETSRRSCTVHKPIPETPMTLSVCCVTHGPAEQVAAVLSTLRPIADEIVVAVDESAALDDLAPIHEIADVAYSLFVGPTGAERVFNWLHRQCSSDWVLRIDSDEVPSAALLAALPDLIRSTDVVQYLIPRRWCFPDPQHWLDERPWAPDWQPRLARNVPGLRLDAELWHASLVPMEPRRYILEPMYHLDCAITPLAEREQKAARYEKLRPDHATEDGSSVNAYYLPEQEATREPLRVPDSDLAVIDGVLNPQSSNSRKRPRRGRAKEQRVLARDVNRYWAFRDVPESAYKASLTLLDPLPPLHAGKTTTVTVRVCNHGTEIWPYGESMPAFRLAHRWVQSDATLPVREGRTLFTADVSPGDEIVQPMTITVPSESGEFLLEMDIVHEFKRWLGCGPSFPVTVLE